MRQILPHQRRRCAVLCRKLYWGCGSGPRGVVKLTADGKIYDTGPLNAVRMPMVNEEFLAGGGISSSGMPRGRNRFSCSRDRVSASLTPEGLCRESANAGLPAPGFTDVRRFGLCQSVAEFGADSVCKTGKALRDVG